MKQSTLHLHVGGQESFPADEAEHTQNVKRPSEKKDLFTRFNKCSFEESVSLCVEWPFHKTNCAIRLKDKTYQTLEKPGWTRYDDKELFDQLDDEGEL